MILRGEHAYPDDPLVSVPVAERIIRRYWPTGQRFFMPVGLDETRQANARVNHGRWIADCPWCPSAVVASPDDPRFFCVHCLNDGGTQWVPIVFPENTDEIEALLDERKVRTAKNWDVDESADDLRDQNDVLSGKVTLMEQILDRKSVV